jgi:hypothetical protein
MSTPEAPLAAEGRRSRVALWALLVLLLLALTSCAAFAVGRGGDDASEEGSARPAPTVTVVVPDGATDPDAEATPVPTVTIRVPVGGSGGTSGEGGASGDGEGSGVVTGGVNGEGSGDIAGGEALPFRLSASALGGPLVPGQERQLRVVVTNPNPSTLTVRTIEVTVKTPTPATCNAAWFTVGDYNATSDAALAVVPQGSSVVLLPIELVNLATTNQNACQGATIPLSLTGTGRLG